MHIIIGITEMPKAATRNRAIVCWAWGSNTVREKIWPKEFTLKLKNTSIGETDRSAIEREWVTT